MAELPHVSNFAAATRFVRPEDVAESVPAGNDPKKVVEAIGRFTDAGVNHVAVVDVGDDLDAFLRAWSTISGRTSPTDRGGISVAEDLRAATWVL